MGTGDKGTFLLSGGRLSRFPRPPSTCPTPENSLHCPERRGLYWWCVEWAALANRRLVLCAARQRAVSFTHRATGGGKVSRGEKQS